jgi:acyl-lipid omega-6 desaturase (Delta-12 desaturase)
MTHRTRAPKQAFHSKSYALPLALFSLLALAYAALVAIAVAAPLPVAIPAAGLAGLAIGLLFIIGHDACHQSLTPSRLLNRVIGRLAFLPSLHPFSLWDLGHNRTHHRFNNVRGKDYVWEPMSPADYRSAAVWKRLLYRLFHLPPGIFAYYGVEIWAKRMFFVLPSRLPDRRRAYVWDLLSVWAFLPLQMWTIAKLGTAGGHSPAHALVLGFLLPFLVWNALMSFVIFLHHIHPAVPWYESVAAWRAGNGRLAGTAHVEFPVVIQKLLLHIMEHNAHHHAPGVPLYNLVPLQRIVERQGGVVWRWSPRAFLAVTRQCKLFDYEARAWRGFEAAA